ncbi:MAG: hypothetical protein FJ118_02825 [Deltaproteobacteria bacterium]|nr:hypothetical protein [Deltaproteobacteria bacterium]
MFSKLSRRSIDVVKLPNHILLYGIVLACVGVLVALGSLTRLYELREFFPLRLPEQVNEFILNYIPFILGTFLTTVAALAGLIVGVNWAVTGLREVSRVRIPLQWAGDYHEPETVSLGLKEGRMRSYDQAPSLLFYFLGKFWSRARFISQISGENVRRNISFIWKALFIGIAVHFFFKLLDILPGYLGQWGLGSDYVLPSPIPFYNLLLLVCALKFMLAVSLVPLKKPSAGREMDSMIVEGKGHPSVFFAVLEEGSKIFAHKTFPNRISRSRPVMCQDGETMIGTLIESFPKHLRTSARPAALLGLLLGSAMVLIGFLQIILVQYPTFSVSYGDFFRLYFFGLLMDIILNVLVILFGKGFLDQARDLMAVYRFRSSLVYVEAKGDFEKKVLPDLRGIVSPERLFDPLVPCAFNVRYFSAEAVSDAVTPEGVRELVALETSGRLAKDVSKLKYLPFQVDFRERYPSAWISHETDLSDGHEADIIRVGENPHADGELCATTEAASSGSV